MQGVIIHLLFYSKGVYDLPRLFVTHITKRRLTMSKFPSSCRTGMRKHLSTGPKKRLHNTSPGKELGWLLSETFDGREIL